MPSPGTKPAPTDPTADAAEDRKIFGFPRNVFNLGLVSFFTDISSEMVYPLLPLFLTTVLGASAGFVGLVEGLAESTASLLKLVSGWLSDKLKKRKALALFGYGLSALARPLLAAAVQPWEVLLNRFLDRFGKGVRTSPRDALVADSTTKEQLGRAFGLQRALDNTGAFIGPAIAFLILTYVSKDLRYLFWWACLPALFSLIVLGWGVKEIAPKVLAAATAQPSQRSWRERFRDLRRDYSPTFKGYILILAVFTLGNSSDAFLLLRAKELGIAIALVPLLWLTFSIVKAIFSIPGGILSDKIGRRKVLVAGWVIYCLAYAGFALARTALAGWLLFILYALYFALNEGVEKAFIADLTRPDQRGTAYGLYNFAIGIMALPASLIMGLIWQKAGSGAAFFFGASLAGIAALLLAFCLPAKERS